MVLKLYALSRKPFQMNIASSNINYRCIFRISRYSSIYGYKELQFLCKLIYFLVVAVCIAFSYNKPLYLLVTEMTCWTVFSYFCDKTDSNSIILLWTLHEDYYAPLPPSNSFKSPRVI